MAWISKRPTPCAEAIETQAAIASATNTARVAYAVARIESSLFFLRPRSGAREIVARHGRHCHISRLFVRFTPKGELTAGSSAGPRCAKLGGSAEGAVRPPNPTSRIAYRTWSG